MQYFECRDPQIGLNMTTLLLAELCKEATICNCEESSVTPDQTDLD
jgi:hypothetical protein